MSRGTFWDCCCQCLHPSGEPLPIHASTGDFPTLAGSIGSVCCGLTAPFLWVLVHARFCLCPQDWSLCFPQSSESPIIKSCWPPRSYSYCIAAASSLSLGYLFWWVPSFSCQWCSTASCDFGALAGDEHTSFYSAILNWKPLILLNFKLKKF